MGFTKTGDKVEADKVGEIKNKDEIEKKADLVEKEDSKDRFENMTSRR